MSQLSHTHRTLRVLREAGYLAGVVERFNRYGGGGRGIRQDLFGFIDVIAIKEGEGIIGVQSCGSSFKQHADKIRGQCCDQAKLWLLCGGRIQLWGWRKVSAKRGGRRKLWKPRVVEFFTDVRGVLIQTEVRLCGERWEKRL